MYSLGLIPARARDTPRLRSRCISDRTHPRTRGEHRIPNAFRRSLLRASSPHGRGTQTVMKSRLFAERLIPALAGSTHDFSDSRGYVPTHTHARGEYPSANSLT